MARELRNEIFGGSQNPLEGWRERLNYVSRNIILGTDTRVGTANTIGGTDTVSRTAVSGNLIKLQCC